VKELALFGIKVANCRHLSKVCHVVPKRLTDHALNGPQYCRRLAQRLAQQQPSSALRIILRHQAPWLPQLRPSRCENSVLAWPPKLLINPRLVTGSAMGSIGPLFDKMSAIHNKHGPFELALCIGDFFGPLSGDNDSDEVGRLLGGELRGSS
jgi:hypothetical protein